MASTTLRVYYGVGMIREGPTGVDLSDFPQVTLVLPDDENARMGDVQLWLTRSFSLNPEVYSKGFGAGLPRTSDGS